MENVFTNTIECVFIHGTAGLLMLLLVFCVAISCSWYCILVYICMYVIILICLVFLFHGLLIDSRTRSTISNFWRTRNDSYIQRKTLLYEYI